MQVYRIEFAHHRKNGPFNDSFLSWIMDDDPAHAAQEVAFKHDWRGPYDMPSPEHDGIDFDRFDSHFRVYHSGFLSISQYHEWFPHRVERRTMFEAADDLVLDRYDVPDSDVLVGGHQVMFRMEHAKLVCRFTRKEAIE